MREWLDFTGQTFGMLTVVGRAESAKNGKRRWLCRCACGTETVVVGSNLTRGATTSCGCKKFHDLTGQKIGRLTILERSDKYATRGKRTRQLWKCVCDCGAITYKATDTLTNPDVSMCADCAAAYAASRARACAGYADGTQITRIQCQSGDSGNLSGVRGVYLDPKTGKYRARITFRGQLHNLGTFATLADAVKARRRGEEALFGAFLAEQEEICK